MNYLWGSFWERWVGDYYHLSNSINVKNINKIPKTQEIENMILKGLVINDNTIYSKIFIMVYNINLKDT